MVPDSVVWNAAAPWATFEIGLRDDLAGIAGFDVWVRPPGASDSSGDFKSHVLYGPMQRPPRLDMTSRYDILMKVDMPPGTYTVVRIETWDWSGNRRVMLLPELETLGFAKQFRFVR
jgi:hypothetical protein